MIRKIQQNLLPVVLLACSLLATLLCYAPGLHGGFIFDDIANILNNPFLRISQLDSSVLWQAAQSSTAGPLHRPVSMASFALNYYFSGLDPFFFKLTNVFIHMLVGVCVYLVSRILIGLSNKQAHTHQNPTDIHWISLAAATLWLLHPFNLTSVLYVVQRMAQLAALFTLAGLILYLHGRCRQINGERGGWALILAALFLCTPLAALSKENGLLLPGLMLCVEWAVLRWRTPDLQTRHRLYAFFTLSVLIPGLILIGYFLLNPISITAGYKFRDFSLIERLMSETRVLWFYLRMIFLPDIAAMGIFHDDLAISRGLLTPPTTLLSILGLFALIVASVFARNKHSLVAFCFLFFLVGHSMESSVIALELIHEHRNYLPMVSILIAASYYALSPTVHPESIRLRRVVVVLSILFLAISTAQRAIHWRNPLDMVYMEVQHHPLSARANADLAQQYASQLTTNPGEFKKLYKAALYHYSLAAELSESDTAGLFGILSINSEYGFSTESQWTDKLKQKLQRSPPVAGSVNALVSLEKCLAAGKCSHSPDLMEGLLRSALSNSNLNGTQRSMTMYALSHFLFSVRHNPDEAIKIAYQAAALVPKEISQQITLVSLLMIMGNLDAAQKEIENIRHSHKADAFGPSLDRLERSIALNRRR